MVVLTIFFRWVGEKLYLLGRKIDISMALFLFIVMGLVLKGPLEHNTMIARAISGSTPNVSTGEGQKLHTPNDSNNGSKNSLPKQDRQLVPRTLLSTNVSVCETKQSDISTHSKGEVNSGLVRRSYNNLSTWSANVKTFLSRNLQFFLTYEISFKHFISLLTLLLVLVGMLFCLMERRPNIGIQVAVLVSILGLILKGLNGPFPTLFEYGFATLIYDLAHFFMFLALILEHTQRELSHLFAGTAYACVHLALLDFTFNVIESDYACVLVAVLFVFVLFAALSGFTSNRAD